MARRVEILVYARCRLVTSVLVDASPEDDAPDLLERAQEEAERRLARGDLGGWDLTCDYSVAKTEFKEQ